MDIGYHEFKDKYNALRQANVITYKLKVPNRKAELAITLMGHFGIVAGKDGGEDSVGRAKIALMPIEEVVKRACDIADLAIDEMDKRGWYLDIPEPNFDEDK